LFILNDSIKKAKEIEYLTGRFMHNSITIVMSEIESSETKEKIIEAAKKEFLKYGYKDASLRHICRNAGVTTGALYFFFKNKEDLLDTILKPVIDGYKKMVRNLFNKDSMSNESSNTDSMIIEFLFENRDAAIILIDCCQGTKYEEFMQNVRDGFKHGFKTLFIENKINNPDENLVDILVSIRMEGYLNMLKKEYSFEELKYLASNVGTYCDAGFFAMVENIKKQNTF